jgi:hypothetical protein
MSINLMLLQHLSWMGGGLNVLSVVSFQRDHPLKTLIEDLRQLGFNFIFPNSHIIISPSILHFKLKYGLKNLTFISCNIETKTCIRICILCLQLCILLCIKFLVFKPASLNGLVEQLSFLVHASRFATIHTRPSISELIFIPHTMSNF